MTEYQYRKNGKTQTNSNLANLQFRETATKLIQVKIFTAQKIDAFE